MTSGIPGDLAARDHGGSPDVVKSAAVIFRCISANCSAAHRKGAGLKIDTCSVRRRVPTDRPAAHCKTANIEINAIAVRVFINHSAAHRKSATIDIDTFASHVSTNFPIGHD
ncbi:hypothetical protein [Anaerotruncus massiliensis (ex Togo et al. 2019)]|uniref:hypothetical protein n=1 Tax=Anaerotruncus massiliensis (ex Togo et al. 2019) TaxID=1673720 RepID=UPI0023F89DC4|nr:hypothetical protein [Anaerotruncus massiliensis (ex Togo et al. 2019)]